MAPTVWLISSRQTAGYDIEIDSTPETVSMSLGGGYLEHPSSSLSFLAQLVAAMTDAGVTTPAAYITEARFVRLTAGANFDVDWTSTAFRDLLGFTGNLTGASAYTAAKRSTLLWSPGKTETPGLARLGSHGQKVLDVSTAFGTEGRQTVTLEGGAAVRNTFSWRHIMSERYFASPPNEAVGEYVHFWENELAAGQRWILLRGVSEGSSTTVSADYSLATALGPYKVDMSQRNYFTTPFERAPGFELVDGGLYNVPPIPVVKTPEFAA